MKVGFRDMAQATDGLSHKSMPLTGLLFLYNIQITVYIYSIYLYLLY